MFKWRETEVAKIKRSNSPGKLESQKCFTFSNEHTCTGRLVMQRRGIGRVKTQLKLFSDCWMTIIARKFILSSVFWFVACNGMWGWHGSEDGQRYMLWAWARGKCYGVQRDLWYQTGCCLWYQTSDSLRGVFHVSFDVICCMLYEFYIPATEVFG